jgi:hypothetical protein
MKKAIYSVPEGWPTYRDEKGWPMWYQKYLEAWWIITGKWSLHKAWQIGMDYGTQQEYHRMVIMGGR